MVSVQRHLALLRGELRTGESERLWVRAERLPQGHAGALLVSDRRLLFSGLGFLQQTQEGWPLSATAAERLDRTGRQAQLVVAVPGGEERFAGRGTDLARVQALLGDSASPPGEELSAALARLADLHTAGALTDAEFVRAKRRLLE